MKIVQFKDGNFGLQKTIFFGLIRINRFVDLENTQYSWGVEEEFFSDCQSKNIEVVKSIKDRLDTRNIVVVNTPAKDGNKEGR